MNWQEVSIYVATPDGVRIYDAQANALNPVLAGDFRAATGTQSFVKDAAVNLVYVSELSKTGRAASSEAETFTAADSTRDLQCRDSSCLGACAFGKLCGPLMFKPALQERSGWHSRHRKESAGKVLLQVLSCRCVSSESAEARAG
jgi:hypothetical protein